MDEAFLKSGERVRTVMDSTERAGRLASLMHGEGVGPGGAAAIMLRNDFPYMEVIGACARLGAYPVSVNWHARGDELAYVLNDCAAKVLVVHADLYREAKDAVPPGYKVLVVETPPEIAAAYGLRAEACQVPQGALSLDAEIEGHQVWDGPEVPSPGSMIYTSGTTGHPKGVRRDPFTPEHQMRLLTVLQQGFFMEPGQRTCMTGPMYHSATNAYASGTVTMGGDLVLMPRFDPEELLRLIEAERITHMHMVPTLFVRLLRLPEGVRAKYDISSLKSVVHGAAPCPPEVKAAMLEWWGPIIGEYYGSTEVGLVSSATAEDARRKPGTVGKLLDGVDLRIFDDDGKLCGPNEAGEMYAKPGGGPDFTYQNRDDARRECERDGYITNGDIGMVDDEGYIFILDRKRDMIISGGVNIYPAEIEAVLIAHPDLADVAVFGIPHEEFGETVCAYVQPVAGVQVDAGELRAWAGERMSGFKVPRVLEVAEELPREETGKIFKRKLRAPYWEKAGRNI